MTRPTLYTREFIGLNLFILMVFVNLPLLVLLPNHSGIGGNSED